MAKHTLCLIILLVLTNKILQGQQSFVKVKDGSFSLNNKPYRYIGTNYWYGSLLALQKDPTKGIDRLKKELDFLKSRGVNNLRILGGVEGNGQINGFPRVEPPLQPTKGIFDTSVLSGLDVLLDEMAKRRMKAIIFLSNNWEWSGGFLQYLNWNGIISDSVLQAKMSWDDMRDHISKFYNCVPCIDDYQKQVSIIMDRVNTVNGVKYISDPTIMTWELANEPRPMRSASNDAYFTWVSNTAAYIRSKDKKHLICLGHEGEIGTQSMELYSRVHANKNIDYLTIHIWPKNWGWMKPETMGKDFSSVLSSTESYIDKHLEMADQLKKPLVIEEFGLPRDSMLFDANTSTKFRDQYYELVFSYFLKKHKYKNYLAGVNFWAFNGIARPIPGQRFWKPGDEYMGDPPMEEQSIYGVFDSDSTTLAVIKKYISQLHN